VGSRHLVRELHTEQRLSTRETTSAAIRLVGEVLNVHIFRSAGSMSINYIVVWQWLARPAYLADASQSACQPSITIPARLKTEDIDERQTRKIASRAEEGLSHVPGRDPIELKVRGWGFRQKWDSVRVHVEGGCILCC
jgi:hypothetical protein